LLRSAKIASSFNAVIKEFDISSYLKTRLSIA
jgi:hypothetical protein